VGGLEPVPPILHLGFPFAGLAVAGGVEVVRVLPRDRQQTLELLLAVAVAVREGLRDGFGVGVS
jgi:hypothetical protein